ncbi:MAG: hypothetical protein P4M08_13540 [Oligoflexia bacterium]|nr:hypothetical protein [Oligoflexia bacterium]
MATPIGSVSSISSAWEVLTLFLIPIGGGIPAGVLLARSRGLDWPLMMVLYFVSDVILACLFEPLAKLMIWAGKRFRFLARFNESLRKSAAQSSSRYGIKPGPFSLVMVAFGVDPMTGRTAALAAGHGFISGWTLAILGDMLFFTVLMISTLCLNSLLGDGTWTAVIIMVVMIVFPALFRRLRERRQ